MPISRAMLADDLANMPKIQSNATSGSAAIRTAFSDIRAKVEDVVERFPEEQDLVVVWDFVCEGEVSCRPNSTASWKPFVIMALHGLKSDCQEHIDAADCARRYMRDGEGPLMRAASAARTRREVRHALEAHWLEASLPMPQVMHEASLSPPGNDVPLQSHRSEPGTEHVEAAKDELQANQEHCLSLAAKKRRL